MHAIRLSTFQWVKPGTVLAYVSRKMNKMCGLTWVVLFEITKEQRTKAVQNISNNKPETKYTCETLQSKKVQLNGKIIKSPGTAKRAPGDKILSFKERQIKETANQLE